MASPKRCQAPDERQLCQLNDFDLLHAFTDLVCKQHSLRAKELACEMMRRYTSPRAANPLDANDTSILGGAKWGDAKRVEMIFGLKRGPLDRIRKEGWIESRSLDYDQDEPSAVRAKRLYDLISIEQYLRSPEATERRHSVSVASTGRNNASSTDKKKPNLKIMQK